jgi:DNA-binding NtrC family response regulator
LLEQYDWPGNIRELENAVVRAVAMCDGTIRVKDLPRHIRHQNGEHTTSVMDEAALPHQPVNDWVTLSEIEGRYVGRVLEHTGGNKQAAARVLAVDRKTLDRMIKRHHITHQYARQRAKISHG